MQSLFGALPSGPSAVQIIFSVDAALESLDDGSRETVKQALLLSALPHWFDESTIRRLLPCCDAKVVIGSLSRLPSVERFPARGAGSYNVLDRPRRTLVVHFREIDASGAIQAARAIHDSIQGDASNHALVERFYLRFIFDSATVAEQWLLLERKIVRAGNSALRHAIAQIGREVLQWPWLESLARATALLSVAAYEVTQGPSARLEEVARTALELSGENGLLRAEAVCLLGDARAACGDLRTAEDCYQEYYRLMSEALADEPTNTALRRDMAVALGRLGLAQFERGDLATSMQSFAANRMACTEILLEDHAVGYSLEWVAATYKVGDVALAQGRVLEARELYREGLNRAASIVAEWAEGSDGQMSVAIGLLKLAEADIVGGAFGSAKSQCTEAIRLLRRLCEAAPESSRRLRELSMAQMKFGDACLALQENRAAWGAIVSSTAIARSLCSVDPDNAQYARDLAVAKTRAGDFFVATSDLVRARTSYAAAHATIRRRYRSDMGNGRWTRDYAVSLQKMGDVRFLQGDWRGARDVFLEAVETSKSLAAKDPSNAVWARDLAVGHSKVGDVWAVRRNPLGAVSAYDSAIDCLMQVLERGPRPVAVLHDIAVASAKSVLVLRTLGDADRREAMRAVAIAFAREALEVGGEHPRWQEELRQVEEGMLRVR